MQQNINLLPWREIIRQKLRRYFFIKCGLAVALSSLVVGISWQVLNTKLAYQYAKNDRIQHEITVLNQQLREFSNKKVARDNLQHRLELVNALQKQRNNSTLLLNLLPEVIPEGVVLDKVLMRGDTVTLEGRSKSNAQLAELLAMLEKSPDAKNTKMHSIVNNIDLGYLAANQFRATFQLTHYVVPNLPKEEQNVR